MCRVLPRRTAEGFGLVEVLVALALGLLVVIAAVAVLVRAGDLRRAVEADARLQETARHALALLEADVRMAGYWGLARTGAVTTETSITFPDKCGRRAWVDATAPVVDGSNGTWLGASGCTASSGGHLAGTDVLVVRRASAQRIVPDASLVPSSDRNRVVVASGHVSGTVFVPSDHGGGWPAGYDPTDRPDEPPLAELRALAVNAYYVSADSSVGRGFPALRRKSLVAGPDIGDDELAIGIEDLQVRIGADVSGDGVPDAWVGAGALPAGARPVTVSIALVVRSETRESGYPDTAPADETTPTWVTDGHRRLRLARTVWLRNSQP